MEDRSVGSMHNLRFYIITGARDQAVPTSNSIDTATLLRNAGVAVSFYSLPEGTHSLYSLRDVIARAWNDMLRGNVRPPLGDYSRSYPYSSSIDVNATTDNVAPRTS